MSSSQAMSVINICCAAVSSAITYMIIYYFLIYEKRK